MFTCCIKLNVPILHRRDCVLVHHAFINWRHSLTMVLLPVGRKPEVIDYIPSPQSPLGIQIFEELIKLKANRKWSKIRTHNQRYVWGIFISIISNVYKIYQSILITNIWIVMLKPHKWLILWLYPWRLKRASGWYISIL